VSESFWKKEISFGRKPKKDKPVESEAAAAIRAVLEPDRDLAPQVEEAPPAPEVAATPVAEDAAELPSPQGDYGWLTTSFDPNDVPDDMPTVVAPPLSLPTPALSTLAPVQEHALADEGPDLEAVVPPPVATASAPFWKKELSFSRGPKTPKAAKAPKAGKQPKAAKAPKAAKEPKAAKQPKAPKEAKAPKEKTAPFWKKELSFGKSKPQDASTIEAVAAPKEKKPPIWKRELGRSKPTVEAGAKQPRAKKEKAGHGAAAHAKTGIVGLKIGASQVAAARISNNNGAPQLLQFARAPLADGVVVGGELRDVETLAETLKELFAKNKLPKKGVRLGIANNRIGVRTFEIGGIDDPRQLANAIRFRAQETLPIPLEEAVLDWQVLSETTDEESGVTTRRVLLVVAYRELVDRYVLACRKAGIQLAGIDLEAFAMLRALTTPQAADAPTSTAAQVLVNVGHDRSTFAVSDGVACEFTRVLGWGGQSLSVAIARALDLTPSQVGEIKHALSLVAQSEPPEGIDSATLDKARDAVTHELQAFARELVSSLRFYQNQPGSLGIGEVILTGGTAHLPGFADELHRLIGVPVRVGDPLNRLVLPKKFSEPDDYSMGSLTVAIGLGIED
jgi:type IV pilus assembly protein PilM